MKIQYREPTSREPFSRVALPIDGGDVEAPTDILEVTDTTFAARGPGFEIRGRVIGSTSVRLDCEPEVWRELELVETMIQLDPSAIVSPFLTALGKLLNPDTVGPGVTVSSPGFPVEPILSPAGLLRAALTTVDEDKRGHRDAVDYGISESLISAAGCSPAETDRSLPGCFPSTPDPVVEIIREGRFVTTGTVEDDTGVYLTGNIRIGDVVSVRINGGRPIRNATIEVGEKWVAIDCDLLSATIPYGDVELVPWLTPITEWDDDDEIELAAPPKQRWVHRYYPKPDSRGPVERALG